MTIDLKKSLQQIFETHIDNHDLIKYIVHITTTETPMNKTKIVYQLNGNGTRYAAITLKQLAKAMWAGWTNLDGNLTTKQIRVDFASDTTYEEDVSNFHGILLEAPFDFLILMTGGYGAYDFKLSTGFDESENDDEEYQEKYPDLNPRERVLLKALEKVIWDEWKDENGLLWCEVMGCVEAYLDTLPENELEVINNT